MELTLFQPGPHPAARRPGVTLSVVVPVFMNEPFLLELHDRLIATLEHRVSALELVFVNDGSPDRSWTIIQALAAQDERVLGLAFTRNFGQHMAITAGVAWASGDWVVVMDGDLQDRPEEVANLLAKAQEGYDVVFARRRERKDGILKRVASRGFYRILGFLGGSRMDPAIANFGIYSRRVIDHYRTLQEHFRLFPLFIQWFAFPTAYVDVDHGCRPSGKSGYTFSRRLDLALDTILCMTNEPLKLVIKLGFSLASIAILYGLVLIIRRHFWGIPVLGWTSLMVALSFLSGLVLATIGIHGLYIGKIFDEVKNRPLYVIRDMVGLARKENRWFRSTAPP